MYLKQYIATFKKATDEKKNFFKPQMNSYDS